ncbi:MAG: hypothetical protein EZS28_042683 [Streblomastix strix]|uniref:Uncharacterized protein n=1 Tax=Streblomastix strix TaxID=222440 RepID=A0A5J4TW29_9EUKA|nr:MAG: hypothetical protein EZS28_042683 [Streblomastix strix]
MEHVSNITPRSILSALQAIHITHSEEEILKMIPKLRLIIYNLPQLEPFSHIIRISLIELKNQIGECQNSVQRELINIVAFFAERDNEEYFKGVDNKIYHVLAELHIAEKIWNILRSLANIEIYSGNDQGPFSHFFKLVVRTFSCIYKNRSLDVKDLNICGTVFKSHIIQIINRLREFCDENKNP